MTLKCQVKSRPHLLTSTLSDNDKDTIKDLRLTSLESAVTTPQRQSSVPPAHLEYRGHYRSRSSVKLLPITCGEGGHEGANKKEKFDSCSTLSIHSWLIFLSRVYCLFILNSSCFPMLSFDVIYELICVDFCWSFTM